MKSWIAPGSAILLSLCISMILPTPDLSENGVIYKTIIKFH